jgi:two-component system sensor histidine kinase DegS
MAIIRQMKITDVDSKKTSNLLYSIFDALPDALIVSTKYSREIVYCNVGALSLFHVASADEFYKLKGSSFHKNKLTETELLEIEKNLNSNGEWKSEMEFVTLKGREFWGAILIKAISIENEKYNLVRITDITHRVQVRNDMLAFVDMKKRDIANEQRKKNVAMVIHGEQQERQRFSKELHDGIGQLLTAIRLQVSAIDVEEGDPLNAQKQKIKDTIDTTITEVKRISHNLMPSAIEDFGLLAAIENLCHMVPQEIEIEYHLDEKINELKLSKNIQFAVYRIAQEAMNNAIKYSGAKKMFVNFSFIDEHELLMNIHDYGKGFKHDKIASFYESHTIGSGLNNMRERAEIIHARLLINSTLGEGTSVKLFIPLLTENR